MTGIQMMALLATPVAVMFVSIAILATARPDLRADGVRSTYLSLACVLTVYLTLLAAACLGEAIAIFLAVGGDLDGSLSNGPITFRTYLSFVGGSPGSSLAAFATMTVLMGALAGYHYRAREVGSARDDGLDRAHGAAMCFAMITLIAIGALVAGAAGYQFFGEPVTGSGQARDVSMGTFISYGALVLVAGLVFRAHFGAVAGTDDDNDIDDPELAELEQ